jgi:sigma-B regulation protein RsbU (phosphoserine phosphatase)
MNEGQLSQVSLFTSLPTSEIQHLAKTLKPIWVPKGTILLTEGEMGDHFYILLEGQVEILKAIGTADERRLALREAVSFLGEMSLFSEDKLHTASVRAFTPLKLLEMSHEDFDALLHRQPSITYSLVRTLSKRLDASEDLTIQDLRCKNRELMKAYKELEAAQAQLVEQERLKRELELARQIQESILPRSLPKIQGFDFGAQFAPMAAVGGDFYDFIPLDENNLALAMGDVSDHGVHAALFMALTVTLLRAEAQRSMAPCEVLNNVNHHLLNMNEAGMFVTILYGLLNTRTKMFQYVRAGHETPMVIDSRGNAVALQHSQGQPLGLFLEPILDEGSIVLTPGGWLWLYTDGVKEAMDAEGRMFGLEHLLEASRAGIHNSAQDVCDHVWETLERHRGGVDQQDDATLVVIRMKPDA